MQPPAALALLPLFEVALELGWLSRRSIKLSLLILNSGSHIKATTKRMCLNGGIAAQCLRSAPVLALATKSNEEQMSKVELLAPVSLHAESVSSVKSGSSHSPPPLGSLEELFKEDNQSCSCQRVKC